MAQDFAEERKVRYCRVRKFTPEIEKRVRYLMEEEQWSPEQIVGWCKKEGLPTVSYERIYQYVRQDKQDGGTLYKHCRNRLKHRKRPVGGKMMLPYKKFVISITSDNGCEFYEHKMIAKKLQTDYFFAHPYSSQERGLNEYTNKLIRQYIPKKQLFDDFDKNKIILIQHKINKRPRKILNFENPKYMFYNKIALLS